MCEQPMVMKSRCKVEINRRVLYGWEVFRLFGFQLGVFVFPAGSRGENFFGHLSRYHYVVGPPGP